MSEITNKELGEWLRKFKKAAFRDLGLSITWREFELAAERLAAMPDAVEQEPTCYIPELAIKTLQKTGKTSAYRDKASDDEIALYTQPQQPAPDKETIKRYCLEFVAWYLRNYLKEDNPQDVIDLWWQQQSAEGGE